MASEHAARFHPQQEILFESAAAAASPGSDLFPITGYHGYTAANRRPGGVVILSPGVSQSSLNSPSSLHLDSLNGLKHDTGLAVEWSLDEQYKLEEGLSKFGNGPNILRYIKIASLLRAKTVRDVALRCKWMARKRRKQEDQNFGKNVKDQKAESPLRNSIPSVSPVDTFSLAANSHDQSDSMLSGAGSLAARHLLEENKRAFAHISANLSAFKLQENIDLFLRSKENLHRILNEMRNTAGIMSRMPPLPVLLNEELASTIFPPSSQ